MKSLANGSKIESVLLGSKTVEFMTSDHLGAIPIASDLLPPGHGTAYQHYEHAPVPWPRAP